MRVLLALIILLFPIRALATPLKCMAEAMYFEARNQGTYGMLAVVVVITNRVDHPNYPTTVCEVVRQGRRLNGRMRRYQCQFSYYCDGKPERPTDLVAWTIAQSLARLVLETNLVLLGLENATHYHTTTVNPSWAAHFQPCLKIGEHIFYEQRG